MLLPNAFWYSKPYSPENSGTDCTEARGSLQIIISPVVFKFIHRKLRLLGDWWGIRKNRADSGSAPTSTREISISAHLIYFLGFQTNFCLKEDFKAYVFSYEILFHVRKEVNKDHENLWLIPGCRISDWPSQGYGQPWALSHVLQSKHCPQIAEDTAPNRHCHSGMRPGVSVTTLQGTARSSGGRLTDKVVILLCSQHFKNTKLRGQEQESSQSPAN